jgi:glycosyltransferase involved in cell wall biosynthesis
MSLRIVFDARHIGDFGFGTYIRNLLRTFVEIKAPHHFILTGRAADRQHFDALPGNYEVVYYERDDRSRLDNIAYPLFLRRFNADLYHIPLAIVPLMMPRPYVVTVHDLSSILFDMREGWQHDLRLFRLRRGLLRAERIIAVSTATQHDISQWLDIPPERICRVLSAPDPRFLRKEPPSAAGALASEERSSHVLERYQIRYPFLLYAGNIRPQKNIPRLVEAFALLRGELENHPRYHDLRLIIIGDEISRYPDVRRAVIQTRVESSVRFLGFVPIDTLRVFYGAAEAFVFPSLYEGFGLPPLEAMAAGTPVVTSNVSSLPEVVGDAACLVSPDNVFDIARGIKEVLLDDELRESLRQRGFERLKHFSWQTTAQQVLSVYNEAASSK